MSSPGASGNTQRKMSRGEGGNRIVLYKQQVRNLFTREIAQITIERLEKYIVQPNRNSQVVCQEPWRRNGTVQILDPCNP